MLISFRCYFFNLAQSPLLSFSVLGYSGSRTSKEEGFRNDFQLDSETARRDQNSRSLSDAEKTRWVFQKYEEMNNQQDKGLSQVL